MFHLKIIKNHLSPNLYVLELLELTGFDNYSMFKLIVNEVGIIDEEFKEEVLKVLNEYKDQVKIKI